jgi:hypothetical protein
MLTVTSLDAQPGLAIYDRIDDVRFELYTDRSVTPATVSPDRFRVPVSTAVTVSAEQITLPKRAGCCVRTRDGTDVTRVSSRQPETLPADAYELELTSLPLKLYCQVPGPVEIDPIEGGTRFTLDDPTEITLGLRSFHEQPAGVVRTTADPFDLMQAVSTFGSALKTTSPERSWPTLRGHPPLLERGDELSIPDGLEPPATDVHVEVPPTLEAIYRVAPLAYYLGAPVEAGGTPAVVAGGQSLPLDERGAGLDEGVHRFLSKSFFLDCLVRTEGLYDIDLHERSTVEPHVPFDFETIYDAPLAERLVRYDEVPYVLLEPELPQWPLCADVRPTAATLSYLPFAANRLAQVRIADGIQTATADVEPAQLGTFFRGEQRGIARSTGDAEQAEWEDIQFFDPPTADATTHAWVGEGYPLGTAKVDVDAMCRRLERTSEEPEAISIRIVCNDAAMAEETAGDLYGLRDLVEFDITVDHDLTTDEFRALLTRETDFLHYIGHVDEQGVVCADGSLDLRSVERTGVRAFLLNACHSYRQGEALVHAGADGGIVTLSRVYNEQATKMGQLTARLLNQGFPLDATMDVLGYGPLSSHRYAAVGDHRLQICQADDTRPALAMLRRTNGSLKCRICEYTTPSGLGLGLASRPHISGSSQWNVSGGPTDEYEVNISELRDGLEVGSIPILVDQNIHWQLTSVIDSLRD